MQVIEGRSFNAGLSDSRFKFLSKEHDTETGLEWLEARGYDARIGRFLTVDVLSDFMLDNSAFAYAYDSPITFADPTGMTPEDPEKCHLDPATHLWTVDEVVVRGRGGSTLFYSDDNHQQSGTGNRESTTSHIQHSQLIVAFYGAAFSTGQYTLYNPSRWWTMNGRFYKIGSNGGQYGAGLRVETLRLSRCYGWAGVAMFAASTGLTLADAFMNGPSFQHATDIGMNILSLTVNNPVTIAVSLEYNMYMSMSLEERGWYVRNVAGPGLIEGTGNDALMKWIFPEAVPDL